MRVGGFDADGVVIGPEFGVRRVRFRPERLADAAWLSRRLPDDRKRGPTFIGEVDSDVPVAAFAVAPPIEAYAPPGLAVTVHIEPSVDRVAVGEQIIGLCEKMAARMGRGPLHAWPHPREGSDAAALWAGLGFETHDRYDVYAADVATLLDRIRPYYERVCKRPSLSEIRPLQRADAEQVLAVWERHTGTQGAHHIDTLARIRGTHGDPYHRLVSRIAVRHDRIVGIMLVRDYGDTGHVDILAMDDDVAHAGDSLRLIVPSLQESMNTGGGLAYFRAMANASFTHRFASIFAVPRVDRFLMMRRAETPSDAGGPT